MEVAVNLAVSPAPPATLGVVMVVDDNPANLKLMEGMLERRGYEVRSFPGGAMALAAAGQNPPDLILLDINFPPYVGGVPWDGFRVMEWFRRLDNAKTIPVIIITGSDDPKFKERASAGGAVAFFSKPIDHDDLLKVIRTTLIEAEAKTPPDSSAPKAS